MVVAIGGIGVTPGYRDLDRSSDAAYQAEQKYHLSDGNMKDALLRRPDFYGRELFTWTSCGLRDSRDRTSRETR
jgi:hypothetical protein